MELIPSDYSLALPLMPPGAFPGGASVKNPSPSAGDLRDVGSIPGLGRYPKEGMAILASIPCLENSMDRRAWRATVHGGRRESDTTEAT